VTPPDHSSDEPPVQLPAIIESITPGTLTPLPDDQLIPLLIADAGEQAAWRYIDFFTSNKERLTQDEVERIRL
jgi:hypothetical protein